MCCINIYYLFIYLFILFIQLKLFHTLGGDVIITYYTPEILKWLKEVSPL